MKISQLVSRTFFFNIIERISASQDGEHNDQNDTRTLYTADDIAWLKKRNEQKALSPLQPREKLITG